MPNKQVFKEFLQEVKGVEKQKKKYEKVARIRKEREPFPYWDEVFMIIGGSMMLSFFVIFMILTKITF